jgi:hypothetical protein
VDSLEGNTIAVWSKDDVPPATPVNAPQMPARWEGLMWGILPLGSSLLAIVVLLLPERRRQQQRAEQPFAADEELIHGGLVS